MTTYNEHLEVIKVAATMNDLVVAYSSAPDSPEVHEAEFQREVELMGVEVERLKVIQAAKEKADDEAKAAVAVAKPATPVAPTAAPAAPAKSAADVIAERKLLRLDLLAQIAACKDIDDLIGGLVPVLDLATRSGELMLLRADLGTAIAVKSKALTGRKFTKAELEVLLPKPVAKKSATIASLPLTEFGVTERMRVTYGDELLWANDLNKWFRFGAGFWQEEPNAVRVVAMARDIVKTLRPLAEAILDPEQMEETLRQVAACERHGFSSAVVQGLACEDGINITSRELDQHPELLCVKNGVVDLRTGVLREASADDRLTMQTSCEYVAGASRPWFEQTLLEVFRGDAEVVAFFKRAMGYSIMSNPTERIMMVPFGKGKNGKSTVINPIKKVLGTHAATMNSSTIAAPMGAMVSDSASGPQENLLRLQGKRVIFSSELKRASVFNDETVKTLASGGDTIVARGINAKTSIEFSPTGVVWQPANVLAIVRDDDPAIWDRLVLLRFGARFGEGSSGAIDLDRPAKLEAESEGILAWMVEGALEYQRIGLAIPASVHALKAQQREGSSPIGRFIEDCCELNPSCGAVSSELFQAWKLNSMEQGEKHLAQSEIGFGRYIAANVGIEPGRVTVNGTQRRIWVGIRLNGSQFQLPTDYFQKRLPTVS